MELRTLNTAEQRITRSTVPDTAPTAASIEVQGLKEHGGLLVAEYGQPHYIVIIRGLLLGIFIFRGMPHFCWLRPSPYLTTAASGVHH